MSTAEQVVAQLEQEQERHDRGETGAKPALDWARQRGYVMLPVPGSDELIHRDVLAIVGRTPVPDPFGAADTTRHAGRGVDIAALLSEPPRSTPWRCGNLVADGTLTILGGKSGDGKSWLALALTVGVARGEDVAGIRCEQGTALYVDAEMGPRMFVERLRHAAIGPEFELRDAMGLDLSRPDDLTWLRGETEATGANLVVIDSLRRLVPSKCENDSDDMAPVVAALAKLARDTGAAILLVHHMGDNPEKFFRGSSAIKDQADALFALLRDDDDPEARRLTCRGGKGKMRYAAEPADRYLAIAPAHGGVVATEAPEPGDEPRNLRRESVKAGIRTHLPAKTKSEVAAALGLRPDDKTFRTAWGELEGDGKIVLAGGEWMVVVPDALGTTDHHHNGDDRAATTSEGAGFECECAVPLEITSLDGTNYCIRCAATDARRDSETLPTKDVSTGPAERERCSEATAEPAAELERLRAKFPELRGAS